MNPLLTKSICLALILFVALSCVKEEFQETVSVIQSDPQEILNTNLYGKIMDEESNGISGARVELHTTFGAEIYETDENGNFEFFKFDNPGNSAYIKVEANGYFDGFRRFSVIKDSYNYTRIMLLDKVIAGSFNSSAGGTAITNEGMKVSIPANAVSDARGQAYNGNVNVAMAWIDPTSEVITDMVIGDLSGVNAEGKVGSLSSFGMVYVELLSENGEELNLNSGFEAELIFPVPSSLQADAPTSIPLWSYDEELGTWIQESIANLANNTFIGKISHFSEWNVDVFIDPISISGCIEFFSDPLRLINFRAQVLVCGESFGTKGGWISSGGNFLFYNFPSNEEFVLKVLAQCGSTIYEENYGPYSSDTDLGVISAPFDNSNVEFARIEGLAQSCEGEITTNGYAKAALSNGEKYIVPISENGQFIIDIEYCQNPNIDLLAEIQLFDIGNLMASAVIRKDVSPSVIDVGIVSTCDEIEEFMTLTIDSVLDNIFINPSFELIDPFDGVSRLLAIDTTISVLYIMSSNEPFIGPGSYVTRKLIFNMLEGQEVTQGFPIENEPIKIEITEFGLATGDFIVGEFSGEIEIHAPNDANTVTEKKVRAINGNFKVRRE